MRTTQHQKIMRHLKNHKGLTVLEGMMYYGIVCLPKRIQELREQGDRIISVKNKHPDTGQRYTRYELEDVVH